MSMRIRTIKPEFWMHEGLCSKSEFTRLLAIALLNWSDDEGYFLANPVLIRGQVFPFLEDSTKIPRALQDLSSVGWIELGSDDQGRAVGKIKNFAKHQRVDKPNSSKLKASSVFLDDSTNDLGMILEDSKEEGKGKEEERNGSEAKGTVEDLKAYSVSLGLTEDDGEFLHSYFEGNGWMRGKAPIKCWKSAFRTWKLQKWLPSQKETNLKAKQFSSRDLL